MTINRKEIGQKIIKMVTYSWKDMERFTDSARTILVVRLVPSCAGRLMTARGNAAPRFLVIVPIFHLKNFILWVFFEIKSLMMRA